MKCMNCGASIEDVAIVCPFCGTENEQLAHKEQQEAINYYKNKTKKLKNLPDRVVRKSTKWICIAAAGMVVIVTIVIILSRVLSDIHTDASVDKQNEQLAQLEEYYIQEKYMEMDEYLDSLDDRYTVTYEKYYRVGKAYSSMEWRTEAIVNWWDYITDYPENVTVLDTATALSYVMDGLYEIQEWEEEGFLYGEGEVCLEFAEEYYDFLNEYTGLNEEEIDKALAIYDGTNESLYEIAELAMENVSDN